MPDQLPISDRLADGYKDNWEYINDELTYLDHIIRYYLLTKQYGRSEAELDQFRGLVITQDEVWRLLAGGPHSAQNTATDLKLAAEIANIENKIAAKRHISLRQGVSLRLYNVISFFHLTSFEERCLLMCLAPEIDSKYEKIYAFLNDDVTRKLPTINLAMQLFCSTAEQRFPTCYAFDPDRQFIKYLVQLNHYRDSAEMPLLSASMLLEKSIVQYILGSDQIDYQVRMWLSRKQSQINGNEPVFSAEEEKRVDNDIKVLRSHLASESEPLIFYYLGPTGAGKKMQVKIICDKAEISVLFIDMSKIFMSPIDFAEAMNMVVREAILHQCVLCFEYFDSVWQDDELGAKRSGIFTDLVLNISPIVFLLGRQAFPNHLFTANHRILCRELTPPGWRERRVLWSMHSPACRFAADVNLDDLATRFLYSPGQIKRAQATAHNLAVRNNPEDPQIAVCTINEVCRKQISHKLGAFAKKLTPMFSWPDIILPVEQIAQLHEVCSRSRLDRIVYDEWEFKCRIRKRGLSVLFSGPPGTGKTMAVEIIGGELEIDVYRIDLSQVVSKYIGETEKNLDRIFSEAECSNAILFFDEADALFGKRSEVKDAHDRYANIEIAYLLQKFEDYPGITILATNLRGNMDEAFTRRLDICIDFPEPSPENRLRIWESMFPQPAPRSHDIDLAFLAQRFRLNGGNIRNIVLSAAFYAAGDKQDISMKHLIMAVRAELRKMSRFCARGEFGEYGYYLD